MSCVCFCSFRSSHLIIKSYFITAPAQGACSTINTEEMNSNIWKNLSSGRLVSPRFPANYPSDFRCVWHITLPERFRVRLMFRSFDLEGNSCIYDYVEMRDGLSLTSPLIGGGRICGGTFLDEFYHSSGSNMLVLFFSDASEEFKGFEAVYSSVLPGEYFNAEQVYPWLVVYLFSLQLQQ